ncbi:MAG: RNA methyltransferase [Nostoc sp. DedQUE05]|uniref:TrmH family RNA methyltransferase n=1 Tax=Nostoc sp. DedQUE05 TaxID=3075391 RepID=UPI002AD1E637|nr:RNA methyltransferase [Nostoc sp. DedQUE05]MDZ8093903.1 RNA methyltransferase [Nostoc sp. DedQUE05]
MAGVNSSSHERLDVEATLTEVKRLQFDRAHRNASGLFYIEGVRNFVKVIDNGFDILAIAFSEKLLTAPLARKLVRQSRRSGIPCISLTPEQFRRISQSERASGVGAIVRQRWFKLRDISPQPDLCWVALETVRSPGNLGTLIRTSEAVGGAGFIFIKDSIDPFAPDVIRASMGSLFNQKFVRTSFSALRHWVQNHHCPVIGASPDGMSEFHQFNYPNSTLLFLGEERQGLTPEQRDLCQHLVRIPMVGAVDSLNLAVAGSLLMYEVYRSRT